MVAVSMKAVILAAGEGNRMRPLTFTRPKVMLPLANRPILEHLLVAAAAAGIKEYVFVVGYHNEQVRSYFGSGDRWGVNISYITQQERLGTADAVRRVKALVDGNFLVMNGDAVISRKDIIKMAGRNGNIIGVKEVAEVSQLGVVEIKGRYLKNIYEKSKQPPSSIGNTGIYVFTSDIFGAIEQTPKSVRGEYEITSSLQIMLEQGYKIACHKIGCWLDCSYPWDLLAANESLLGRVEANNLGEIEDNVVIKGNVSLGAGTTIRSGCYIVGPVIIGSNCDIGPQSYIRPFTSIGDGCRIGAAVEVKASIIMRNTKIPHHSYIGDSIVGEGCNFGSGTKIANLRLDGKNIRVSSMDNGRRKLGAIIGDGVATGINSSINVGSLIGDNVIIGPGALASGIIAPGSKVF
jgi:UDP-N-acetylglucosamine diphosphorylase/glucosamine-1-phosphate N-acetyltransferase